MKHFLVGTAGHVDHGKTSLIHALTQVDTDRLPEEKERGLSIDLGFAPLPLSGPSSTDEALSLGIVDVPGHQKFLRNMIAGVGGFDAAMLIIDPGEGVKPQTREHLTILELLETPRGLVVLSKIDRYDEDSVELARWEVQELLQGTFLEGADIVTTSVSLPESLEKLKSSLYNLLARAEPRSASGVARLPIDRTFSKTGFGDVVTGSLWNGTLKVGDEVELLPGHHLGRVRGLQVHGESVARAVAGQRVAVNLSGLDSDRLGRGVSVVSPPKALPTSQRYGVALRPLEPLPERLARKSRATFFQGTGHATVSLRLLAGSDSDIEVFGQLEFEEETFLCPGDRFLLRDETDSHLLAGGRVLAPDERALQRRQGKAWLRRYQTLAGGGALGSVLQALRDHQGVAKLTVLLKTLGWSRPDWDNQVAVFTESGHLRFTGDKIWDRAEFQVRQERTVALLEKLQSAAGWKPGWRREELGKLLGVKSGRDDGFFDLLETLVADGILVRRGAVFTTADYRPALPQHLQAAADQLERNLLSDGVAPRDWEVALSEVCSDSKGFTILSEHLLGLGRLTQLTEKLVFVPKALSDAREILRERSQGAPFTASQAKEWLDISRKFIIPVLEWMDAQGWTHRTEDERIVKGQ